MENITANQIRTNIKNLTDSGSLKTHIIDGEIYVEASSIALNIDKITRIAKRMSKKSFLAHEIDNCDVSIRTLNALHDIGAKTVSDVLPLHNSDFLKSRRGSKRCWEELDEFLAVNGLTRDAYKPIVLN